MTTLCRRAPRKIGSRNARRKLSRPMKLSSGSARSSRRGCTGRSGRSGRGRTPRRAREPAAGTRTIVRTGPGRASTRPHGAPRWRVGRVGRHAEASGAARPRGRVGDPIRATDPPTRPEPLVSLGSPRPRDGGRGVLGRGGPCEQGLRGVVDGAADLGREELVEVELHEAGVVETLEHRLHVRIGHRVVGRSVHGQPAVGAPRPLVLGVGDEAQEVDGLGRASLPTAKPSPPPKASEAALGAALDLREREPPEFEGQVLGGFEADGS